MNENTKNIDKNLKKSKSGRKLQVTCMMCNKKCPLQPNQLTLYVNRLNEKGNFCSDHCYCRLAFDGRY